MERRQKIYQFLKDNGECKLQFIVDAHSHWYHANAYKHIGSILYRLVKSGKVVKPKHGYYAVNTGVVIASDNSIKDHNQTNLFQ